MSPLPPEVAALVEEYRITTGARQSCECPRCRLLDALLYPAPSPPAPVEDDGLDAALAGWLDGHDLPTTGQIHAWLRELQARRRGER